MVDKIKALPKKVVFAISLTVILVSPLLLFLLQELFSFSNWTTMIIQGIVFGVAILFIVIAADKKYSRFDKEN